MPTLIHNTAAPQLVDAADLTPIEVTDLSDLFDLRQDRRFNVVRPVELIPIGIDGLLDIERRVMGTSRELSVHSLAVDVPMGEWHSSQQLLLGMHWQQAAHYAGIIVRRIKPHDRGFFLGAEFGGLAQELIEGDAPLPTFDRDELAFVLPQSPTLYENWSQAGVVEKTLLDRVLVCPRCCGVPTFRHACRKCGAGRVKNDRLIHHFACAYVGLATEFTTESGEVVCPKCRQNRLVVGADFEYLTGENLCGSCGWRDSETELYGHCLRCNWRFEMHQAREQELHGYHVRRLAPLAVITDGV